MEQWKHILGNIEQNPQRADLVAGFLSLCKTIHNPMEQASALVSCAKCLLPVQPLISLRVLQLALVLSPRSQAALDLAKEIFKRRGRWAAEQRVAEFSMTQSHATATVLMPAIPTSERASAEPEMPTFAQGADAPNFVLESSAGENPVATGAQAKDDSIGRVELPEDLVDRFLILAGHPAELAGLSVGLSKNNSGLVAFVGLLFGSGKLGSSERERSASLLLNIIKENPDDSGAEALFERLFGEDNSSQKKEN
jgi:hypothetical protein